MMLLKAGDLAPTELKLPNQDGEIVDLTQYKGKKVVVYFYPKDNTPGCTTEAKNFRDSVKEYEKAGIEIIGISADSVNSHKKFQTKYDLPFTLLADTDKQAAKIFGAIEAGKIKRRTWLIDESWKIEKVFDKVSPTNHNGELCEYYLIK